MSMDLSIRTLVIILISIALIAIGIFLLSRLVVLEENLIEYSSDQELLVTVTPSRSQKGTLFLVNARLNEKKDTQDIGLLITNTGSTEMIYLYDDGKHFDGNALDGNYGGYFDSTNKPLGIYKITNGKENLAEFEIYKEKCELIYGDIEGERIDFAIVPYGYENYEDFKKDAKKIILGNKGLLSIEPFKSNEKNFSFYLVNTTKDLECTINCRNVSTLVCCNDNKVLEEAYACTNENVFVLLDSEEDCGSSSSYAKVCAKSDIANLVLIHELGHSFGDLADEYVYSDYFGSYDIGKINNPNCAEEGCKKWQDITSGCYPGCTYSYLYRPSEKNSMMLDLEYNFNDVCKNQITEIIKNYISKESYLKKISPFEKSYYINLKYQKEKLSINNIILKPVKSNSDLKNSIYEVNIQDKNAKELYQGNISLPNIILPFNSSSSPLVLESLEFPLMVPYISTAHTLSIKKQNQTIDKVYVGIFNNECKNNVCDYNENHIICPEDCSIKDNFCQKAKCDPDCTGQENCQIKQKTLPYLGIILIALALILVIIVLNKKSK
ncbi:MAG: M64 family metallopeptidase [Candidatus Nanoarchaeia archaeon]